jgi:hypothetical protein
MWVTLPNLFGVFNQVLDDSFQLMMQTLRVTR